MDGLEEHFKEYPSRLKVARLLLSHGMRVEKGVAYCGDIQQSDSSIGRAAGVDRRVVKSTLQQISDTPELDSLFSKVRCMLSMRDMAREIGCSSLLVVPTDAKMSGILSGITEVLYRHGLSIRQAVVDDSGDRDKSVLSVVIDGELPPEVIPELRSCRGVDSIVFK